MAGDDQQELICRRRNPFQIHYELDTLRQNNPWEVLFVLPVLLKLV